MPGEARFELFEGKLERMAPAGDLHVESTLRLSGRLLAFIEDNDLRSCWAAETGFLLATSPDVLLASDFTFIYQERLGYPRGRGCVPVVPDLVVEARSPGDRAVDVAARIVR